MQLSTHLSLAEFIVSDNAKRHGIDNTPTPEHLENAKILANKIFEPIRLKFGKPIYLSSGYRSKLLNGVTKGASKTSEHCTAEAMDLDQDGRGNHITNKEVFDYIKDNLEFNQLIWEFGTDKNPDWVHASYSANGKQKKQILKAIRVNGKPKYIPYV
ncbi:MAG: D-Ala-D-Ala carboxypeptidase family metallohydrolase [Candidatus Kapaibacteriota bacterium]